MKRIDLTDAELNRVIVLRQAGSSWMAIEKEVGVPRRVAQRAYGDWARRQSIEEFKKVRMDAVEKEFSKHVTDLTELVEVIVDGLPPFPMLTHLKRADEVLTGLLTRDLGKKDSPEGSSDSRSTRKERHLLRYNQSLLSSLKEHTHEKVRWAALEEWKQAWDGCIDGVIDIWVEAIRIILAVNCTSTMARRYPMPFMPPDSSRFR